MKRIMSSPPENMQLTSKEKWHYANFTDSFVFGSTLEMNPLIARKIIEAAVPELKIREIEYVEREARQQFSPVQKMSFLDIRVKLDNGKYVLIEMQIRRQNYLIRRNRFYRSEFDVKYLKSGASYESLPDVIQIMICCFDPFNEGRYVYDFEFREKETMHTMEGNGQRTILLNAHGCSGKISDELKSFLDYVSGKEAEGDLVEMIDDTVNRLKYDTEKETEYMKLEDYLADKLEVRWEEMKEVYLEEIRQKAITEGLEEGRAEGLEKGRAEGLEKGRTEGLEKGRTEGLEEGRQKERIESVRASLSLLLEAGVDCSSAVSRVAGKYGMSADDVRRIAFGDKAAAE